MSEIKLKKKYRPLFECGRDVRYYVVTGGRGSSKSFSVNTFATLLSFEPDNVTLFTRYTMTSAHMSIIPEFIEKIELLGLNNHFDITKTEVINKISGSNILFKGIKTSSGDQTANLKSIQGVTTWILDEAEELLNEDVFDKIDKSIRKKGKHNRVILILNPSTKEHWIYKRFFEGKGVNGGFNGVKDNVCYIHTTYLDNIDNLDQSYIDILEELKQKNIKKYNHIVLGGWLDKAEGVIFTNWKTGKFNENISSGFGQDYGFSIDPTTLVEVAIDKKQKKIYIREHLYKPKLTTSQICEINKRVCGNKMIIADSAEPRLIAELKSKGCNIYPTEKGQGSVSAGLALMQDYELIIDPDSINVIKELNNYCWHERKSKEPIDAYNHIIDAVRYYVFYTLSNPNKGKYSIGFV